MQVSRFTRAALMFIAFSVPTLGYAQFQAPTSEELKMTADPTYPDAAAVYLNRDIKTDDLLHFQSEYVRIKILKESAKELATVHLGYYKGYNTIAAIEGRTIHADGTIVPLNMKPEDLMRAKAGETEIRETVFNLPSVEVGSILEYSFQIRFNEHSCPTDDWEIQLRYPVRKAHFSFMPCAGVLGSTAGVGGSWVMDAHGNPLSDLLWYAHLPDGKPLTPTAAHRFNLDVSNVPPLPQEDWMPPVENQRYQVKFYFSPGTDASAYWNNETKYWIADVNKFAEAGATVRDAAKEIVSGIDGDLEKAKKLYAAVQALDNTNFSRKKSKDELKQEGLKQAKSAEDTWKQKSGSGEEIALLYLAMLRSVGLTAYPVKVVNRSRAMFDMDYLNFHQLNDLVIVLSSGGKEIVLDPAEKMCPFQMVAWQHSGAGGVRQLEKGLGPWTTPFLAYGSNGVTRRAELTLSAAGAVTGNVQIGFTGQEALAWRQFAIRNDEAALQQHCEEWLRGEVPSGIEVHFTRFANLDNPDAELTAYATVSGTPGTSTSTRLMLPAWFFANHGGRTFTDQPHRTLPVDMQYAAQTRDGVVFHLPSGYTVESLPQASSIPWTGRAVFQSKAVANGTNVTATRTLSRAFTLLGADEYGQLRDFYQKVAAADQQQLVLKLTPTPTGN